MIDELKRFYNIKEEDIQSERCYNVWNADHYLIICDKVSYKTNGSYFAKWYWIDEVDGVKAHGYDEVVKDDKIKRMFNWKSNVLR